MTIRYFQSLYFMMNERNRRNVLRDASLKEKLERSRSRMWIRSTFVYEWCARG